MTIASMAWVTKAGSLCVGVGEERLPGTVQWMDYGTAIKHALPWVICKVMPNMPSDLEVP